MCSRMHEDPPHSNSCVEFELKYMYMYNCRTVLVEGWALISWTWELNNQAEEKRPALPHRPVCGTLSQNGYGVCLKLTYTMIHFEPNHSAGQS